MIRTGTDFSGVGAFDQALERLGIEQDKIFACDMDKYARQTYIHNYGEPKYYPENVYDREIPKESLGVYMTSPPCQSFSIAGKRKGEDSANGVLFFNSHEFIQHNKPRYFIFENVKGLLSDNGGKTFAKWLDMLGGKSVNGNPVIFPHEESVPYHIYHKVINAKKCGVPQNRERVFIVGIRDDCDNTFSFPKDIHLTKRLKDVLESEVDEKYYLSQKLINFFIENTKNNKEKGNGFAFKPKNENDLCNSVTTKAGSRMDDNYLKVKSVTKKGYEIASENDSINFTHPDSETRRGRVGKGAAQTLDTACDQGVWIADYRADEGLRIRKDNISPCMTSSMMGEDWKANKGTRNPPIVGLNDKIRRLTPTECFRLMDFNPSFKWNVSDTQAYKQAGNSIVVACLVGILSKLNL
tara:strand:- start:863 stop:2092 length:1230 start_codon:yes stop_codon:yes gene_type:complete